MTEGGVKHIVEWQAELIGPSYRELGLQLGQLFVSKGR